MFYIILAIVAVLVLVVVLAIAMQSPTFRIERTARIDAPPSRVFEYVDDLRKFQEWSPFAALDPNARLTHEGPPRGVGTSCHWSGNNRMGEGRMTIVESVPDQRVRTRLEFVRPFTATNVGEFTLAPTGDGATTMTWAMSGQKNVMSRVMHLFMNIDKMVGRDFERGLATLNTLVTSPSRA